MYTPAVNRVADEAEIRAFVAQARVGWFLTADADRRPAATLLPLLWRQNTIVAHLAVANPQWRDLADGSPILVVVPGPDAYVSPSWYPAKAEHGRVVPTWNYTAVQLTGTVVVRRDPAWLHAAVRDLTAVHEQGRAAPWAVGDAPPAFVDGQLRGIVGLEVTVAAVEGKAKLSQNRSLADRRGVVAGLAGEGSAGAAAVADLMRRDLA